MSLRRTPPLPDAGTGVAASGGPRPRGPALLLAVVALWTFASCARCGARPAADAGATRVRHSIDLRSALMLTFPEYRGAYVTLATATLTRTMSGSKDWSTELARAMAHNNFAQDADGGAGGSRPPFRVDLVKDAPAADLAVTMALDGEGVQRVYNAPFAISTLELGLYLPKATQASGLATEREVFELYVAYTTTEQRAAFLSRQLIDLSMGNGQWTARGLPDAGWQPGKNPDGSFGDVPERFEVTLDGKADGATLCVRRDGKDVEVRYTLVTDAPQL